MKTKKKKEKEKEEKTRCIRALNATKIINK